MFQHNPIRQTLLALTIFHGFLAAASPAAAHPPELFEDPGPRLRAASNTPEIKAASSDPSVHTDYDDLCIYPLGFPAKAGAPGRPCGFSRRAPRAS